MIIIAKWNKNFVTIVVYCFETLIESACFYIQSAFRANEVESIKTIIGHRNRYPQDVSVYVCNRSATDQIHWNLP